MVGPVKCQICMYNFYLLLFSVSCPKIKIFKLKCLFQVYTFKYLGIYGDV